MYKRGLADEAIWWLYLFHVACSSPKVPSFFSRFFFFFIPCMLTKYFNRCEMWITFEQPVCIGAATYCHFFSHLKHASPKTFPSRLQLFFSQRQQGAHFKLYIQYAHRYFHHPVRTSHKYCFVLPECVYTRHNLSSRRRTNRSLSCVRGMSTVAISIVPSSQPLLFPVKTVNTVLTAISSVCLLYSCVDCHREEKKKKFHAHIAIQPREQ